MNDLLWKIGLAMLAIPGYPISWILKLFFHADTDMGVSLLAPIVFVLSVLFWIAVAVGLFVLAVVQFGG